MLPGMAGRHAIMPAKTSDENCLCRRFIFCVCRDDFVQTVARLHCQRGIGRGRLSGITARAVGGDSPFGGEVNQTSDLDDLVSVAWGTERLGLHRGHAPIQNVLEAFLGITHSQMHIFMEEEKMNLADVCRRLGFAPENLVESLAASFAPFVEEGVRNGVIAADEAAAWNEKIRDTFHRRVHWRK